MKIALACDHGGYLLKNEIIPLLKDAGHEIEDFGCYSLDSVDYPDYAFPAAEAVANGKADRCILICTTGIGVSICANKVKGIRCALCTSVFQAEMTQRHNNANALAMGAKTVTPETAWEIVRTFLETEFEGGRHQRRVQKIMDYEG
ncbi:MAG: ribose 5-phosphate isomerase B [Clostridia bacterium]|nr:ribose 5-phosphate isomerase B [Clostridia bacterium]